MSDERETPSSPTAYKLFKRITGAQVALVGVLGAIGVALVVAVLHYMPATEARDLILAAVSLLTLGGAGGTVYLDRVLRAGSAETPSAPPPPAPSTPSKRPTRVPPPKRAGSVYDGAMWAMFWLSVLGTWFAAWAHRVLPLAFALGLAGWAAGCGTGGFSAAVAAAKPIALVTCHVARRVAQVCDIAEIGEDAAVSLPPSETAGGEAP
jgi:hypothetical protein